MKRKPTFAPYIGSISEGTMRPEDLIPTFASELRSLLKKCRVDRETRKAHMRLVNEAESVSEYVAAHPEVFARSRCVLAELQEALETYAPPYTYFGANEGDGASYGFWPFDMNECDGPVRLEAGDDHREHWGEDVLLVNDHGNVECGRYDKRGRWHEYWSCV